MKKLCLILTVLPILTACTTANDTLMAKTAPELSLGQRLVSSAIDHRCRTDLPNNQYYKIASGFLSESMAVRVTNEVCTCVSTRAPKHVDAKMLAHAVVDSDYRGQLAKDVVKKTLTQCTQDAADNYVNQWLK